MHHAKTYFSNYADTEPTDSDLMMFVARKVSDYESLGTSLKLTKEQIKMFETQKLRDPFQINMKILDKWKQSRSRKPVTWRILIQALREIEYEQLADELEKKFGPEC